LAFQIPAITHSYWKSGNFTRGADIPRCMKTKIFLLVAFAGLSFAGTKSYDITFDSPAVLGPMEIESGQYKLSFDGSKVTLVNENTRKSFETTATVQTSGKKFNDTVVESKRDGGKLLVDEIQLGGTKTALDFKR
jgi:hypothetical protein